MASKNRRIVNGALLGVAATALTVKTALSGPLGAAAQPPLDEAQKQLGNVKDAALVQLEHAVTTGPGQDAASPSRPASAPRAVSSHRSTQGVQGANDPSERANERRQLTMRRLLIAAAQHHGVDPKLILALSFWESGWDQSKISATGAVGLMQIEPASAVSAGPALLGRNVDINDPADNADVGAAIFREDLDNFGDPAMALAAYYQGPDSVRANGMLPDTQQYVEGIMDLATRME
jgi:soluble lytic murein transglycosylase-like protein